MTLTIAKSAALAAVAALLAGCSAPLPQDPSTRSFVATDPSASTTVTENGNLAEVVRIEAEEAPASALSAKTLEMYAAVQDGAYTIPAIEPKYLTDDKARQAVHYYAPYPAGTIIVDPGAKRLYHLQGNDTAIRYTVAVGEAGRGWSGEATVPFTRAWPRWTPTQNMIERSPEVYKQFEDGMEGGLDNPLGARALYLFQDGRDTLYRIHGTRSPWSIGRAVSSGCIRLFNQDIIHLASRVTKGARVIVLTEAETGKYTTPPSDVAEIASRALDVVEGSEG